MDDSSTLLSELLCPIMLPRSVASQQQQQQHNLSSSKFSSSVTTGGGINVLPSSNLLKMTMGNNKKANRSISSTSNSSGGHHVPKSLLRPPNPAVKSKETLALEASLSVEALVHHMDRVKCSQVPVDSSEDDSDVLQAAENEARLYSVTKRQTTAFDRMKKCRRYIERNLESDSSSSAEEEDKHEEEEEVTDAHFKEMLKMHIQRRKLRKKMRAAPEEPETFRDPDASNFSNSMLDDDLFPKSGISKFTAGRKQRGGGGSRGDKPLTVEQLKSRRKRLWVTIVKKEITKAQKARNYNQKEKAANCKRVATQCMRSVRQKATQSQRVMKETVWRAKRLTREMQAYWKRFDRVEKQQKRQQEKEAEEQHKMDVQLLEAKRQQRKLNFLITQTELYSHFIAKKVGGSSGSAAATAVDEKTILSHFEEDKVSGRLAEIDDYDCAAVQTMARNNASQAFERHEQKTKAYNTHVSLESQKKRSLGGGGAIKDDSRQQPALFAGTLKAYQLKGMNWLMNLYDEGINGILADEMGLGKTIQALSMLAFIAEKYNIWGPFLVITPASTLHNWQQEVERFVPSFKVVPYWGSPQERKVLRHFWDQKNLHTRSASFHLVITSYQLVVTDFKYFSRIKWQYLVLDEAQAIKSSSSQRWKMLLEFKCRNRLLLSGTPIQNSMAELWSLLHFVMPTLFDSHEEFNDWFSKDIESSAESKSQVDEKQISRLHMILKPFMLRRIKKDVENELTDKLEVLLYCPLTIRQKLLYMGLKRKIKIEELLQGLGSQSQNSAITSSLMNLVMQFRKVCNHPELFERREPRAPFAMNIGPYLIPKLVCRHENFASKRHLLYNRLCVFNPANVSHSLQQQRNTHRTTSTLEVSDSPFSYLRFVDTSPGEQYKAISSLLELWLKIASEAERLERLHCRRRNSREDSRIKNLLIVPLSPLSPVSVKWSSVLSDMVFTGSNSTFLSHEDVSLCSMQETVSHRLIRTRHNRAQNCDNSLNHLSSEEELFDNLLPEIEFVERSPTVLRCQPCQAPPFLFNFCPRVATPGRLPYAYDRSFAYKMRDHVRCSNKEGLESVLYGSPALAEEARNESFLSTASEGGICAVRPKHGFSNIVIPNKQTLVSDSGKLHVLDGLLARLKEEGHRVLIYSQMTRMIDLLEEYMWHRKHTFIRLDGSSKISDRRDMVADFQQRADIFVFLLSTRAGGLGINLTAADTVIFYDSDWNPTVDQQAMDRAHRLGQTKQVTVYRLICKGTIEERILQRAREKSEIQRMVIQGGSFKGKPGELKPKEVVSLLLDDEEIERKYMAKKLELKEEPPTPPKRYSESVVTASDAKRIKLESSSNEQSLFSVLDDSSRVSEDDSSSFTIDVESNRSEEPPSRDEEQQPLFDFMGEKLGPKRTKRGAGGKRGRPRGSSSGSSKRGLPSRDELISVAVDSPSSGSNGVLLTAAKRGPGRPRLKMGGAPLNQGGRGPPRQAKPGKLKSKGLPAALAATLTAKYSSSKFHPNNNGD